RRAEEDVSRTRGTAEPAGENHDAADSSVVVSTFEPDSPERCITGRNPHPEPEVVSALPPIACQARKPVRHRQGGANRRELMVGDGGGIIEERHHPVTCEVLDDTLVRDHQLAHRGLVLAQDTQHLFGLSSLRERREPAKVAEQRTDLAPMPGEKLLALIAGKQVRDLWCESRQLRSLPLDDLEKTHVLDRDHHVIGERLYQSDLGIIEGANLGAAEHDRPYRYAF